MPNLGLCRACKGKVSSEAPACPHCGQPNPYEDQLGQVRALMAGGKKIDAIKVYQELTGCDLAEAKSFVDSLVKNRY